MKLAAAQSRPAERLNGMKLLTCVIPCYNSAAYMENAVASLLPGGDEMDILIVDDGSTDATGAIADRLAAAHPESVRVHHQPNGGHGAALNFGIRDARGLFFKVVDSDDRVEPSLLPGLLDLLRQAAVSGNMPDLVVHDYVYDAEAKKKTFRVSYRGVIPSGRVLSWDQTRRFHIWNQFMIHCLIYRTRLLRDRGYTLPEHTFYEDNLYIFQPLFWTKKLLYYPQPLHLYSVGRSDQSIYEATMLRRIDQNTSVITAMATTYRLSELETLPRHLRQYMINNVCGQLSSASVLHFLAEPEKGLPMNRKMWQTIRDFDPALCRRYRRNPLGWSCILPGRPGRKTLLFFFRVGQKMIHMA